MSTSLPPFVVLQVVNLMIIRSRKGSSWMIRSDLYPPECYRRIALACKFWLSFDTLSVYIGLAVSVHRESTGGFRLPSLKS